MLGMLGFLKQILSIDWEPEGADKSGKKFIDPQVLVQAVEEKRQLSREFTVF